MLNQNKQNILNFYKKIFTKKMIMKKIFAFLIILLIILTVSFVVREKLLENGKKEFFLIKNFLKINIFFNSGISFSILSDHPNLVFALQIIVNIFVLFIFLINPLHYLDYGICLIFAGGLANIIDRKLVDYFNGINNVDTVVDYFQFSFIKNSAIFNFPDVSITCGSILFLIIGLIWWIKFLKKRNLKENKNGK